MNVFERIALLAQRRRKAGDPDRPAAEFVDDGAQQPPIDQGRETLGWRPTGSSDRFDRAALTK